MAILQGARITGSIIATSFIKASGFSGSLTASNLYVLGKAGIGTTSPGAKLDIRQTSAATGLKVFTNDTSTAYIAQFIGYDNSLGDTTRMVVQAGGNVGIGTTSPAYKLDVKGYIISDVNSNGVESGFYLGGSAHGLRRAVATNDVYLYTTSGTLYLGTTGNSSQQITLLNGGNVGIGTTSPANKFHVIVAGGLYNASITNQSRLTGSVIIQADNSGANSRASLIMRGADTIGGAISVAREDTSVTWKTYMAFYTNNVTGVNVTDIQEKMRLNADGNLGIGTSSPGAKLDVNGDVYVSPNTAGKNTFIFSTNASNDARLLMKSDTTTKVDIQANGTSYFNGGNVGIGTTAPFGTTANRTVLSVNGTTDVSLNIGSGGSQRAYLYGVSTYAELGTIGSLPLRFAPNNSEKMRLDANGNLGIGTSSPQTLLHVNNGEIWAFGATNERILLGDSTSAGQWGGFRWNTSNDNLQIVHSGYLSGATGAIEIVSGGNVGIGTTSPANKLHVSGSSTNLPLKLEGLTSNATGYFLTVDNTTGVVYKSTSGASGTSGTSGANGSPGTSGTSGQNGSPGTSGSSGSGSSGISGSSGTSGTTNIKAWVHFDGTGTPTINASLNVSSITDNNTGDYTINFTTAFANANYVVAGTVTYEYENPGQSINNMFIAVPRRPTAQLAGSCRISTPGSDNALYDCKYVRVLFSN